CWGLQVSTNSKDEAQKEYDRVAAAHPSPAAEDRSWAREHFGPGFSDLDGLAETLAKALPILPLSSLLAWGGCASAAALVLRVGRSFRVYELRVRDRRGRLASRWRCLLRSFVTWVPLAVLYSVAVFAAFQYGTVLGFVLLVAAVAVHVVAVVAALVNPAR